MSTLATNSQPTTTLAYVPKSEPSFEFTKRKRWQDLLIAELHNTYTFILSLEGKILYCSPAIAARFGWKPSELLNTHFGNLLGRNEDQTYFQAAFNEAILEDHDSFELVVQMRKTDQIHDDRKGIATDDAMFLNLKCSAISGPASLHSSTSSTESHDTGTPPPCEFVLLLAMPFFSKNTETLHSIMDLNAQIIRNVARIIELRGHLPPDAITNVLNPGSGSQPVSMYATSSLYAGSPRVSSSKASQPFSNSTSRRRPGQSWKPFEAPPSLQLPTVLSGSFQDMQFGETDMDVDRMPFSYGSTNAPAFNFDNESAQIEEGPKKKKLKRSQAGAELHVCIICGRTDSPEWRKGPQGPKTLCNACGLRWAKQVRKKNPPAASPRPLPHPGQEA